MSIRERILADVKEAMKSKEAERLSALRFLQAAIKNQEIELRPREMTDEDVIGVIKKNVKQRKESIEQYEKASRQDLVEKEQGELKVLESYLPEMLSDEDTEKLVDQVIADLKASSIKEMGAVMKEAQARSKGLADNKVISQKVKARLSP